MTSTPTSWGLLKQPYKQERTRGTQQSDNIVSFGYKCIGIILGYLHPAAALRLRGADLMTTSSVIDRQPQPEKLRPEWKTHRRWR